MKQSMKQISTPLLEVKNLVTHFQLKKFLSFGKPAQTVHAVDDVSFTINPGEVLGLVGESGCGKSTIGRTLTHLDQATSGQAYFNGQDMLNLPAGKFKPLRRKIQMIFQDPYASLNPRMKTGDLLAEPLWIHGLVKSQKEAKERVQDILQAVGLDPAAVDQYPHAFSGGQRQRIAIGRAMILEPELIIADEPVSALDVSIQAQVLSLIKDLQMNTGIALLFISHDLGVIRYICDRVVVMYLGRIVEVGTRASIFSNPGHPYTRLLFQSIPRPNPLHQPARAEYIGEPPSPIDPPRGCRFHPRCHMARDKCRIETPVPIKLDEEHWSMCHYAEDLCKEKKNKI